MSEILPTSDNRSLPGADDPHGILEVHLLGMVDFDSCQELQDRLRQKVAESRGDRGFLLLCEHPPLVTMGREASLQQLACAPEELVSRQMDLRWLGRGGGCIVHGPGQLAIYPVVGVHNPRRHAVAALRGLEQALLDVCGEQQVSSWLVSDSPGIWTRGGLVAHVGLAVRDGVTRHGLFLNVQPDLELLRLARGPEHVRLTSLSAERQRLVSPSAVREGTVRAVARQLGFSRYHLYTGHPLLKRTRRIVAYA